MNKILLTGILTAGTATQILNAQPTGQEQRNQQEEELRPNILFILSDDHTSQAWGIYGGILAEYAYNTNIRRLAKEGVVLDNCFCTNSIQSQKRTLSAGRLPGYFHPHSGNRPTSKRIQHRACREMAHPVSTTRI